MTTSTLTRRLRPRVAFTLGTLAIALTLAFSGGDTHAQTPLPPFPPQLVVEALGANSTLGRELVVSVDLSAVRRGPGRISLYVPKGEQLYPDRDPGSPVGTAFLYLRTSNDPTTQLRRYSGPISAEPAAGQLDTNTQACSPGPHKAIWLLHLSRGQDTLTLPIAISATVANDPPESQLKLDLCPPAPSPNQVVSPPTIAAVVLVLADLDPPAAPGLYLWRALITPLSADGSSSQESRTYELRALLPVRHPLTLHGRYLPSRHLALLTGTLRAHGHPQGNHLIDITTLNRTITQHGVAYHDTPSGETLTTRDGSYQLTLPIRRTRGFLATTPPTTTRCTGTTTAPAGCTTTTTAGAESDPITISIP